MLAHPRRSSRGATFEVTIVSPPRRVADGPSEGDAIEKRPVDDAAAPSLAREARFLALCRGRVVPALLDVGRDERGPFLLEARVEGTPLATIRDAWSPVPFPFAVHLARELARAYDDLHALADDDGPLDAAHGDPSFDNALLTPVGRIAIVDFGEANARGLDATPRQAGTPPYAAPELLRADAAPSQATDRYAVAAMILALVSPAPLRPEAEPSARIARLAVEGIDPTAIAAAPAALRAALASLLHVDAASRAASLSSLRAALDGVCSAG